MQSAAVVALMMPLSFAAYTAAVTRNVFQWAEQPPKLRFSHGNLNPHPIHGSLGPSAISTGSALFAGLTNVIKETTLLPSVAIGGI